MWYKDHKFQNLKISQTGVTQVFFHHNSDLSLEEDADISLIPRIFGFHWIVFSNRKQYWYGVSKQLQSQTNICSP